MIHTPRLLADCEWCGEQRELRSYRGALVCAGCVAEDVRTEDAEPRAPCACGVGGLCAECTGG